jgi:hypothetical protein
MENEILKQILSELQELKQGQAQLEAGQASLVSEVREIKERVIIIENEHKQSLDALHDGYSLLFDISQEIREDVRRLFKHQDKQDARIMLLVDEKRKSGDAV